MACLVDKMSLTSFLYTLLMDIHFIFAVLHIAFYLRDFHFKVIRVNRGVEHILVYWPVENNG